MPGDSVTRHTRMTNLIPYACKVFAEDELAIIPSGTDPFFSYVSLITGVFGIVLSSEPTF